MCLSTVGSILMSSFPVYYRRISALMVPLIHVNVLETYTHIHLRPALGVNLFVPHGEGIIHSRSKSKANIPF